MTLAKQYNITLRQAIPVIAAILLPGLGHYILGEKQRATILLITILSLFTTGLLIGGIDVIDYQQDTAWFAGQSLIGPISLIIGHTHQKLKQHTNNTYLNPPPPSKKQPNSPFYVSINKPNELGTLYCAVAGLLNLLVIIDTIRPNPTPTTTKSTSGRLVTRNSKE